jgi:preprotein translocase subunit YajC
MSENSLRALLAEQPALAPDQTGALIKNLGFMVLLFVVMLVIMIGPQRKKAKQLEAMLKALKPGDKIVTASGILGVVITIKDRSVTIRSGETKMEVLKSSVAEITERSGEAGESKS